MKKKWGAKVGMAIAQIVLQYRVLYCDLEAAREVKVYYKRWLDCIAAWGKFVLQGLHCIAIKGLYCKRRGGLLSLYCREGGLLG